MGKVEKTKVENRGAKQKDIDWEKVENLLIGGANGTQVAASLGICPDTLYLRCKAVFKMDFSAYLQQKKEKGNTMLHVAQFKAAKDGNVPMLIWLGKQRLGQSDKTEVKSDITSKGEKLNGIIPIQWVNDSDK